MKESYEKGPANRSAPNPTPAMVTQAGVAWQGGTRRPGISDPHHSRVPTLSRQREGITSGHVHGESPTDANANRKSDESVVPATSANNDGAEASAESAEERDSAKGTPGKKPWNGRKGYGVNS